MAADAITVSPFLGFGSVQPFLDVAQKNDAGVFVLALTSNKEGPEVQHARNGDVTVAGDVLARLKALNGDDRRWGPSAPSWVRPSAMRSRISRSTARCWCRFRRAGRNPRRSAPTLRKRPRPDHSVHLPCAPLGGPGRSALRDSVARVNSELVGS